MRIAYVMTSCKPSGPTQQTLNIIKHLDRSEFEPILITIYPEEKGSRIAEFKLHVEHVFSPMSKVGILLGRARELKNTLISVQPDVVHSVGVFPDYAVSRIGSYHQITTLRNNAWEDYPAKFGAARGSLLVKMQQRSMGRIERLVACSQSLKEVYEARGYKVIAVHNGVDTGFFNPVDALERAKLRDSLGLPADAYLCVYSGQLIPRKNHRFLLECFCSEFGNDCSIGLVLLGDGPEREGLRRIADGCSNVYFMGDVEDVRSYLNACDCYVSSSLSEGMPNGVLEAMACGLPSLLSDIEQHREIVKGNAGVGFLYESGSRSSFRKELALMRRFDSLEVRACAREAVETHFSAQVMSEEYQKLYQELTAR